MKKVRYKDVKPGDVLGIYIGNDVYAFMRLLWLIPGNTYLCEVFDYKGTELRFNPEIVKAPRLMPIVDANWWQYLKPKWWRAEVVFRDDTFVIPKEELRSVRLMTHSQTVGYDLDWTPDCNRMRVFAEFVMGSEKRAELSKIHASLDLAMNPENLICEIRNRLKLIPVLSTKSGEPKRQMVNWMKANNVYLDSRP